MPSRVFCPGCVTAYAYSPALLGRSYLCRACGHRFTVEAPAQVATAGTASAGRTLVPPPLPARGRWPPPAGAVDPEPEVHEPRPGPPIDPDRPRTGLALFGLGVTFLVGCLVLCTGVGYIVWPGIARSTAPTGPGPSPPAEVPVVSDKPRPLSDVLREAPKRDRADEPAAPPFPRFDPPFPRPGAPPRFPPRGKF